MRDKIIYTKKYHSSLTKQDIMQEIMWRLEVEDEWYKECTKDYVNNTDRAMNDTKRNAMLRSEGERLALMSLANELGILGKEWDVSSRAI